MKASPTYEFRDMQPDKRLAELMLYVADKCSQDAKFGATKLNKILFFCDFLSFQEHGEPITGSQYMRLERGPVPKRLVPVRDRLIKTGAATLQQIQLLGGKKQHRLVPLREPDVDLFKASQIEFVNRIIDILRDQSAEEVSELSHNRVWRIAKERESIPYEAAFISDEDPTPEDVQRAKKLIAQHNWDV